jgi:hypothetical protein
MKLKNIFNTALLFVTALTILSCTDVENEPSYTGRSSGPATKLNVKRDSVDVGDALQFSMGSSSIILGV